MRKGNDMNDLTTPARDLVREERNKATVIEAFDAVFNRHDWSAFDRFWSPDYIQHSAHVPPGRDGLRTFTMGLPSAAKYEHDMIAACGDIVFIHGRFSGSFPRAWIAADMVRLVDGLLVEHWDVIEDEATQESSAGGAPMFGDRFPI
jgi:predicted SnoaL-like aldol condensation-catalyzing enzyme